MVIISACSYPWTARQIAFLFLSACNLKLHFLRTAWTLMFLNGYFSFSRHCQKLVSRFRKQIGRLHDQLNLKEINEFWCVLSFGSNTKTESLLTVIADFVNFWISLCLRPVSVSNASQTWCFESSLDIRSTISLSETKSLGFFSGILKLLCFEKCRLSYLVCTC